MFAVVEYAQDNPLPLACIGLLLVLPGVFLAGVPVVERALRDVRSRATVAPGLGLCLWLIVVELAGRASHSFVASFVGGTLAVGLFGYAALALRLRKSAIRIPRVRPPWPLVVVAVLGVAVIVPATLLNFHDELTVAGHWVTIGQLQNGHFPPRFPTFPEYELRYHYAFDVLAAMVSGLFRTGIARSIDVTTLVLWFYTIVLLYRVGERFVDERRAWLTPVVALFGGGVPFFCRTAHDTLGPHLLGQCKIDGLWLAPSTASEFFQHPFSLGFPLALMLVLVLAERDAPSLAARGVAMGIVLVALATSQIVVFATVGTAALAAECLPAGRLDVRRAGIALAIGIAALVLARVMGGFFAPAPYQARAALELHLGVTTTAGGSVRWMAQTFGLLLVAGPIGVFLLRRERLLFAAVIAGCLVVINTLRYAHSWDIVKFGTVGAFFLGISSSASVAWLLRRATASLLARVALRLAAVAGLSAIVAAGAAFHYVMIRDVPGAYHERPEKLSKDDATMLAYLRRHVRPGEIVFRDQRQALGYAQWGGIATPFPVYPTPSFGFPPSAIAARWRLLRRPSPDVDAYRAQGMHWFVLSRADRALQARMMRWVSAGTARPVLASGSLSLFELLPRR